MTASQPAQSYAFGKASVARLEGVHPIIQRVAYQAIAISTQDFGVFEGVRTLERQKKLVAAGASRTLRACTSRRRIR